MSRRTSNVRRPAALAAAVRGETEYEQLAEHLAGLDLDPKWSSDLWVGKLAVKRRRAETIGAYLGELYCYTDFFADHHPAADPGTSTVADIEAYRDHLVATGLSPATVRVALCALRVYFRFRGGDKANPAEQVPLPKPGPPAPRAYTREQAERLLAAILTEAKRAAARGDLAGQLVALRDYTWTALMYFTGLRQGEVRRLRRGDLDLHRHAIKLVGKGGKPRTLTMPPVLVGILEHYLATVRPGLGPREHVFAELADDTTAVADPATRWRIHGANTNLNRLRATKVVALAAKEDAAFGLGPWTINNRLTKYGRLAGLDGAHGAHRWRHTHASLCLQAGMTLEQVAERLGHDLTECGGRQPTTYRYLTLPAEFLHDLVEDALTPGPAVN